MKTLDRKLLRDLWKMKGQALAIALVIASGVATYVLLISTMNSLTQTRERFYQEYAFADVFGSLKRAPEGLRTRISEIPGVAQVETRVSAEVKLQVTGFPEPVTARIVSVPDFGSPLLNRPYLRRGRMVAPWRDDEAVVSEAFAEAHRLGPGDAIGAVINGRWKKLRIVGIALSPEFVLQVRPGALSPDYKRYAILWMGRHGLGVANNMDGAFNDLSLTLTAGAHPDDVITRLDAILAKYGGLGAYARKDQMSHRFLTEEFRQLQRSADIFPAIFIGVAAFLLNVVVTRTISTQRDQIAVIKAFGYHNWDIGLHYMKLVALIVILGIAAGLGIGAWLGRGLGNIYMEFYRFPYLNYEVQPSVAAKSAAINLLAALSGALLAVRRAVNLPPAEAMRPEPPAEFKKTFMERLVPQRILSQPTRIIMRNIERRPVKALLSVIGISMACAIMVAGRFSKDAVDYMVEIQFRQTQREDMTVTFVEPTSRKAVYEMKRVPGVEHAEVFRSVPVVMRFGHRSYRTSIRGVEPGAGLHLLLNEQLRVITPPRGGILLTDYFRTILGVHPGDLLTVEALEGNRPVLQVPVAGMINQFIGLMGYMDLDALNRLMKEGSAISGVYIAVDSLRRPEIYRRLVEMPRVAGTLVREDEIRNFYETQAEALLFFTMVATVLAATIAFGVVYNSARIALSERGRELASLRVLGYTRGEISYIFMGELGFLTLAAIPVGFLVGKGISVYIAKALESDLYRVPVMIDSWTYSFAAAVVVLSACISGLIVRHRLDHLDLVAVLKTRE